MPKTRLVSALLGTVGTLATVAVAQTLPGATTIAALAEYPAFFQGKAVIVRGEVSSSRERFVMGDEGTERSILLAAAKTSLSAGRKQVRGTFWDVGRSTADDPRLPPTLRTMFATAEQWPKPGDVLLLDVDTISAAEVFPAPSIRALALEPQRYADQRVTVRGQFRGRNLFGDLPASPAVSRDDFVLRSADAAIWVTQLRPRGKGFDLDVNARVDTSRWLEVSGVVRRKGGLVWIEGAMVELTQAVTEAPAAPAATVPVQGPPAKVVFSLPTQGEIDVDSAVVVKLQVSRDLDPASIANRIKASYMGAATTPPAFQATHARGSRVIEIRFKAPLERFRTVVIELLEGMKAADGATVEPYTLQFTVGS